MNRRLLFLGPPGAGKGTQAQNLSARHGILHLSTGEMLRAEVGRQSELGRRVEAVMARGELVADDLVLAIVRERLLAHDGGWLLDGFPRTSRQAEALETLLAELGQPLDLAVLLELDDALLTQRLLGRGRTDDTADTIANRLAVYREKTAPLISYYDQRGLLRRVDGSGTIDAIGARLEAVVQQEA